MFLQRLDSVQTTLRTKVKGVLGATRATSFCKAPAVRTRSLVADPSPAIFPRAQTDCSATFGTGELSNSTNLGIAPALITSLVCSDVPEATLVKAQAASNCSGGLRKDN